MLLEPKEFVFDDKTFLLGKVPCADAREIFDPYIHSLLPKCVNFEKNNEVFYRLMSFCGIRTEKGDVCFVNKTLLNNHISDYVTLKRVEWEMIERNVSFLEKGQVLNFLKIIAQNLQQSNIQMSTPS